MKKLVSYILIAAMMLAVLPTAALAGVVNDTGLASSTVGNATATLEPEESEVVEPIPGTNITEEELEEVLVGLFGAMEEEELDLSGGANYSVNYAYTQRTASQDLIDFIAAHENSPANAPFKPMWDYQQWSIGFGTYCPSQPNVHRGDDWANGDWSNYSVADFDSQEDYDKFEEYVTKGMSLAEAKSLLATYVNSAATAVNNIARRNEIALTQNQFDALVDFTYALGARWGNKNPPYRLHASLLENYHGQQWTTANSLYNPGWFFINGLGTWCTLLKNGVYVADHGVATRRVQELEIFQYGDYYGNYRYDQVPNGEIHYTYLLFNANGGTLVQPSETDWTDSNRFYFTGSPYGSLMNATRSGYYFAGWYTAKEGGTKITADTIAEANRGFNAGITVYAHWSKTAADPEIGSPNNDSGNNTSTGFSDVAANAWYAKDVTTVVELGLMNGAGGNRFNPTCSLTRGMVVTVLHRIAGSPGVTGTSPFKDVSAGYYCSQAAVWALENGITTGTSATTFHPDRSITRQELTTLLYRFADHRGESMRYSAPGGYTDFDQIADFAIKPMCWAWTNGLIKGQSATTLAPQATCTRAEAATIFVRYVDKFE